MTTDVTQTPENTPETTPEKTPLETPETTSGGRIYRPLADIVETDEGVTVVLEMPGVGADDVDITLEKRVLTIRGKVKPTALESLQLAYAEYGEGGYERSFTLGEDFDPEKIGAAVSNGVLTITLPRLAEASPRKIAVKAA